MKGTSIVECSLLIVLALASNACANRDRSGPDVPPQAGSARSIAGRQRETGAGTPTKAPASDVASSPAAPQTFPWTYLKRIEAESMTHGGGSTGLGPNVVTLFRNGDSVFTSYTFPSAGHYSVGVRGQSSNASPAGVSLYVAGVKRATLSFPNGSVSLQAASLHLESGGPKEIRLKLETDNGANDTIVDAIELSYQGPAPPAAPAPVPAAIGAFRSGVYRNLFAERGYDRADIQAKLDAAWDSLFSSTDDTRRVYYPAGANANGDLAYIKDTGNGDVRTEGMSYGMMIAVQMNKKAEFDALWNWAKSYMQHQGGARRGFFAWQCSTSGAKIDNNPAPDGEAYFATALFFASGRWGDGDGIYDYRAEADAILETMLHKEDMNGGVKDHVTNMFNRERKQIVFVPYSSAAGFTNPSYHLPAFFELWGRWARGYNGAQAEDRAFWLDAAASSRSFFASAADPTTGLAPDYSEFSGVPNHTGGHGDFRFDAWRVASNVAVDYAWFAADASERTLVDRLQAFFHGQGFASYANQYTLDGTRLSADRSPGLIATNAVASLAATDSRAWQFVDELWNLSPPTGRWRYYDGLLYFLGLLHTSGNFRIYPPGAPGVTPTLARDRATPTPMPSADGACLTRVETARMSRTGGNTLSHPAPSVILYSNGDNVTTTYAFPSTSRRYTIKVRGASSNDARATIDVYVGGTRITTLAFSGTSPSVQATEPFSVATIDPVTIELRCVGDVGRWDNHLYSLEVY